MELHIKNMVCDRCKMAVKNELAAAGIAYSAVELGTVTLSATPDPEAIDNFRQRITDLGFELITDKAGRLVSLIKKAVIEYVRTDDRNIQRLKFSAYLAAQLGTDYTKLSSLFSEMECTTIEQYLIHQKIERVKELLVYGEKTLSEISDELGYSSVQHLSSQFKKVTGFTPSHFRSIRESRRQPLDLVK